jgi:hypothetical protein
VHTFVRPGNIDLLNALHFLDGDLRYKESILSNLRLGGHPAKLTWPQHVSRIRE